VEITTGVFGATIYHFDHDEEPSEELRELARRGKCIIVKDANRPDPAKLAYAIDSFITAMLRKGWRPDAQGEAPQEGQKGGE
jgi:hypothetical protein